MRRRFLNEKISEDDYLAYINTLPAVSKNKCVLRINQLSHKLLGTDGWFFFYPDNFTESLVPTVDNISCNYYDLNLYINIDSLYDQIDSIGNNYNRRIQLDVNCEYLRDRLHRNANVSFDNILDTLEAEADRISNDIECAQNFKKLVDEICSFTYKDLMCNRSSYDFRMNRPKS